MKTDLFTICLLFMLCLPIQSQTTYDFMSRPGLTFASEHYNWVAGTYNNTYQFVGDTLLCGENLLVYAPPPPASSRILLRVEGGKVWRKIGINPCEDERMLYNFDLEIGDTTDVYLFNGFYVVDKGTITLLNGEERKRLLLKQFEKLPPVEWVDGIGSLTGGPFQKFDFEGHTSFICVKENGETIWQSTDHSTEICDSIACFKPVPGFDFEVDLFQVNFENHSFNQSSVHWDFGDGNTSTELHPAHNYENPGCYKVTLSLASDCLSGTFEKQLLVPVCKPQEWEIVSPDFSTGFIMVDFVSETVGWAINRNQIWKTEDRGISWTEQSYPIPAAPISRSFATIDMVDEMNGVIGVLNNNAPTSIQGLLVTNDGGQTWEEKMPGSYMITFAIMTSDGQVFGTGRIDGVVYSNDWGNSFVELPTGEVNFSRMQYLGNNKVVAMGFKGLIPPPHAWRTISISDDSGQSWTHNFLPAAYFWATDFHYFNSNEGFVCGFEGFLIKTEDGGQSWQEIAYDDDRKATNIYFVDEENGWAVGNEGLVLSTNDGGNTWLVGNCGNRQYLGNISALDSENCWISTGNGRYFELNTEAEVDCSPVVINELNTGDNKLLIFPNPASETVTISMAEPIVSCTNKRLAIYNKLGQIIYEGNMLNERLVINTRTWSSGVYFIKWFQNGQFSGTEKLIVLN